MTEPNAQPTGNHCGNAVGHGVDQSKGTLHKRSTREDVWIPAGVFSSGHVPRGECGVRMDPMSFISCCNTDQKIHASAEPLVRSPLATVPHTSGIQP